MSPEQNQNRTEKVPESTSFIQQRLGLALDALEQQSDVNVDLSALIASMNEKGERSFWFDEEDPKSIMMPGGRAVVWRYGIELPSDPKEKIQLTVVRLNDKITDADQDMTIFSAETNSFGKFDFHMVKSVKEQLDFKGVKSEENIRYPIERVETLVSKLLGKFPKIQ